MILCDFLKMQLKGNRFQDTEETKQNALTWLLAIPKSQFQKCFRQWMDCWNKHVVSQGDCFEGD
jgi:hypothetical protein